VRAVGSAGRSAQGLPQLGTFLGLNPRSVAINPDADLDGLEDSSDNCPAHANPGQEDGDGDTVGDACDNCTLVANTDQRDTDADLFGNICDTDLNNDNITNNLDVGILKTQFLTAGPDADFNGDGIVNNLDVGILKTFFLQPPGPSGLVP
jgi:hypothetical protein